MPKTIAMPRQIGAIVLALLFSLPAVAAVPASSVAAPEGGAEPLTLTPTSAEFPLTTVGTQSATWEFDVANEGSEGALIGSLAIEGADASDFGFDFSGPPSCGGSLEPGQHCTVRARFAPVGVGDKQASLVLHFNDGRPDQAVALSGTSVAPQLEFTPGSHDFGTVWVNSGTDTLLQLTNTGEAAVQVGNIDVTGDSSVFGTGSSNCWGWLQPSQTCSVQVWFNPHDRLAYSAQLRASASGYLFTADLSGAGGRAILDVSPNPVEFGLATAGTSGPVRTITLSNSGDLPANFFIGIVAGGDAGSFRLLDEDCSDAPVMPSSSCTAHVRFAPEGAGRKSARLAFFGDGDAGGAMVLLEGTGVSPLALLTPSSLDFGPKVLGRKSSGRYLAVRNHGTTPVALGAASIVGLEVDQFSLTADTCSGTTLAPGGECLLRVRFSPDGIGPRSATLRIGSDAGMLSASLSGTGVPRREASPARLGTASRGLRDRFRRGATLSLVRARCHFERCRVAVSPRRSVGGD